jgi:hypothetical protein
MMKLLAKRATELKSGNYEKARKIQEEMTAYKNEHFIELTRPKCFYCTFHHEYAYHKAINYSSKQ